MADEDKVRGLSPHDLRRILGDALLAGVKLLGKKSDDTFENIKSDDDGRLQVYDPKVGSLISYSGTTTADGAPGGLTLVDTVLTTKPDFNGNLVIITSGDYEGQARDINGITTGGTVTPASAFGGRIVEGTTFVIVGIRTVPAEVAVIEAKLDAAEAKLDKLAGETPVSDSVTANWQSGTGTSGEAGEDLVTLGANDTRYKLHSLLVNISALTVGATITVKLFMQVHGTERKVYSQAFTQGTDPDGLWIVNGTVGIHEALRVEVQSNNAGDNGRAIDYDYMLEAM